MEEHAPVPKFAVPCIVESADGIAFFCGLGMEFTFFVMVSMSFMACVTLLFGNSGKHFIRSEQMGMGTVATLHCE